MYLFVYMRSYIECTHVYIHALCVNHLYIYNANAEFLRDISVHLPSLCNSHQ